MSKVGESILRGARDSLAYARGDKSRGKETIVYVPTRVDVRALRKRLGLTQAEFAGRYGFKLSTLRDWEQGRRQPDGPARVLLTVIDREPRAVARALAAE
ncbi:MAG: helix-turn-helix domain-containing protein [Dongiaceae bacterium]